MIRIKNIESTCRDVKYISESKPLNPFYLKSQLDFFLVHTLYTSCNKNFYFLAYFCA